MQYSFKYMLSHKDSYKIDRLNDTIFMGKSCFQLEIILENKSTMPGFATKLEDSEGTVSTTLFIIDKQTYYPLRMFEENYSTDDPEQKVFIDQIFFDIKFNLLIDEEIQFNTSDEQLAGYRIVEMDPGQ